MRPLSMRRSSSVRCENGADDGDSLLEIPCDELDKFSVEGSLLTI